jgi:hypothetical protein
MSEFTRSDYLRIKWPFVALAASLMVGIGLFAGLKVLNQKALTQLQQATTANQNAHQNVDKISLEEATIRANSDRYKNIKTAGTVGEEDRLQMQELFGTLRSQNNLFPIPMTIATQIRFPLKYGELDNSTVNDPGRPIVLQISNISFKMLLLHENDFANLLNGLLSQPEFLQIQSCTLGNKTRSEQSFRQLGQHLSAECVLSWYTFYIDDPKKKSERKR